MHCRISDLRCKEVVNVKTGTKIGMVCDVAVDTCNATVQSIIVYGRCKFFGLLGREDDIVIPWCDINIIGRDTVLVNFNERPCRKKKRKGVFRNAFKGLMGND